MGRIKNKIKIKGKTSNLREKTLWLCDSGRDNKQGNKIKKIEN